MKNINYKQEFHEEILAMIWEITIAEQNAQIPSGLGTNGASARVFKKNL